MKFDYYLKLTVILTGILVIILLLLEQLGMQTFNTSATGPRKMTKIYEGETGLKNKKIVCWTSYYSEKAWMPNSFADLNCKISSCDVTFDRSLLNESDAIVMHWCDVNMKDLPRKKANYRIILLNYECPARGLVHDSSLPKFQPIVDWVATYRLDSDIYAPYGSIKRRDESDTLLIPKAPDAEFKSKRLVAWMVSNCDASSGRRHIVNELVSHGVEIDEYGACPAGNKSLKKVDRHEAYRYLAKRYKFYLAFENNLCRDYASEKIYESLHKGMVPIVFGGANYRNLFPENSFIDVLDFASLKELANYLMVVGNSEMLYSQHHKWRTNYNAYVNEKNVKTFLCSLCEKLHNPNSVVIKRNADLLKWWNKKKNCFDPSFESGKLNISETRNRRYTLYSNTE